MGGIEIPLGAIGRVGMIASLKRLSEDAVGKLVLIKEPAGMVSTLVSSDKPVFAWLAIVLGEQLSINGRLSRHIYIPDACLVPVSQVSEEELASLSTLTNQSDFQTALDDLAKVVGAEKLTWEEVEGGVERAVEIFALEFCLRQAATPVVLQELGFRRSKDNPEVLEWALLHDGIELKFIAGSDSFGNWRLVGTGNSNRTAIWDERLIPGEAKRGEILRPLLSTWRSLFPAASCPPELEMAAIYERHLAEQRRLYIGLPRIHLDGEVFRSILKWLKQRHEDLLADEQSVVLSFSDGLLRVSVQGLAYGCPAHGNLIGACQVHLRDLLSIPPYAKRGSYIAVVQDASNLTFAQHSVPFVEAN